MTSTISLVRFKQALEQAIMQGAYDGRLLRLLNRTNQILDIGSDDVTLIALLTQVKTETEIAIASGAQYDHLVSFLAEINDVLDGRTSNTTNWGSIAGTLGSQIDLVNALNGRQPANARLSEIGAGFNAAPDGAPIVKAGSSLGYRRLRFNSFNSANIFVGTSTLTNTTDETLFHTFTIPAGTLTTPGDRLFFFFSGTCTSNTNVKTLRVRVGSITGSIIHQVNLNAANQTSYSHSRILFLINANTVMSHILAIGNSIFTNSSSVNLPEYTIDFSQQQTFVLTGQLATASDQLVLRYAYPTAELL